MSDNEIDVNVDNYTREDLLGILHLPDDASVTHIRAAVARQVARFRLDRNTALVDFFIDIQQRLLEEQERFLAGDLRVRTDEEREEDEQVNPWLEQQFLDDEGLRDKQMFKPLRWRMTSTFTNEHQASKQQTLRIQETYDVGVAQGENNPTLINTTRRTMVVDSKLRDNLFPHANENANTPSSSSQFSITLTDPLKNCLSLSLTSVTLPKSWYNVDYGLGTNIMWIDSHPIYIPSGFYDPSGLADAITDSAAYPTTPLEKVTYDSTTGRFGLVFTNLLPTPIDVSVVFWSRNNEYVAAPDWVCTTQPVANTKVDYNLGYFMGFREYDGEELGKQVTVGVAPNNKTTYYSEAAHDLEGTKNVYVFLEDHNQNRQNSQIITIAQTERRIIEPSYKAPLDLSYICLPGDTKPTYLANEANKNSGLTQNQIFSINSITANQSVAKDRVIGPQQSNLLAVVPVQSFDVPWSKNVVAVGNQLQTNKRVYFGPVDINKLTIKLLDDVGNTLNLHGRNWTFTAEVTSLYQY